MKQGVIHAPKILLSLWVITIAIQGSPQRRRIIKYNPGRSGVMEPSPRRKWTRVQTHIVKMEGAMARQRGNHRG